MVLFLGNVLFDQDQTHVFFVPCNLLYRGPDRDVGRSESLGALSAPPVDIGLIDLPKSIYLLDLLNG